MLGSKKISIVINTYNRKNDLYKLLECINKLDLHHVKQIIVVDDHSNKNYTKEAQRQFPKVTFIVNKTRMFLIKARNIGWKATDGEVVCFIDDDNEIYDHNFFNKALMSLEDEEVGVLGCRAYYFKERETIFVGPNAFNFFTGKTSFMGLNKNDKDAGGQKVDTHDTPNAFFVRRKILAQKKGFDEKIVQTFSEADIAQKARSLGYRVVHDPELKVYHKSNPINFSNLTPRQMGGSPERFYFLMRNRFFFIHKYGSLPQKIIFTLVFSHLYNIYYLFHVIKAKDYEMMHKGILGICDGYICMMTGKLRRSLKI